MPIIAPDSGGTLNGAGLQPLQFQNPALFVPQPTDVLAQAKATNSLQQLGSQLELEKMERQADLAKAKYNTAVLQHLSDPANMNAMGTADLSNYLAKIQSNRTSMAQGANDLIKAEAFSDFRGPELAGGEEAIRAANARRTAEANIPISSLSSMDQQALAANRGGIAQGLSQWFIAMNPDRVAPGTGAVALKAAVEQPSAAQVSADSSSEAPAAVTPTPESSRSIVPTAGTLANYRVAPAPAPYVPGSVVTPGTGAVASPTALPQAPVPAAPSAPAAQFPVGSVEHQIAGVLDPGSAANAASVTSAMAASVIPGFSLNSVDPELTDALVSMRRAEIVDKTTDLQPVTSYDGATGNYETRFVRFNKKDGSVYSQTDPIVTKSDSARVLQHSAQDIVNLQASQNLLRGVQDAYANWVNAYGENGSGIPDILKAMNEKYAPDKSGKGFSGMQAAAGIAAANESPGYLPMFFKGVGGHLVSEKTNALISGVQRFNASLNKLDPDSQKGMSGININIRDLITPEYLGNKIVSAQEYTNSRLSAYIKDNISPRLNPDNPNAVQTAPLGTTAQPGSTASVPTHLITDKTGMKWAAILNQDGSYTKIGPAPK